MQISKITKAAFFGSLAAIALGTWPAKAQTSSSSENVVIEANRIQNISVSGSNDYAITNDDIESLPAGANTQLTDVLSQLPGVGIDQNQQVHIRNTEGSGFQYQIDGVLIPVDITTNPPFVSMINPMFVQRLDLLDGVLPAQYSYSTGGVVSIETKDGCGDPGGTATLMFGQRGMLQPSVEYGGCSGNFSYYGSLLYTESNLAFSSATPGPEPVHDWTNQGQAFGVVTYALNSTTKLRLMLSTADSDNQLPDVPDLTPQFSLANAPNIPSSAINSYLNFRDYLGVLSLEGAPTPDFSYQVSYVLHSISELYVPDNDGELIYQGVASTTTHRDFDNTLQGDVTYKLGQHTISAGIYVGAYDVTSDSSSLVFPADANGNQTSNVPINVVNDAHSMNMLTGIYIDDLWRISPELSLNIGLRRDELTGFSHGSQYDPTLNLSYTPETDTTFHAGAARYFQVPSFEGISPNAPASFANTTGEGPLGETFPLTEDDWEWDAGVVHTLLPGLNISEDNFYEITRHYLDAGQFGVVPIFAPFNYVHGDIWGAELAIDYKINNFSASANVTLGRNLETGVATGQFNFTEPGELQYIDSNYIVLDHQAILGISSGIAYDWDAFKFSVDTVYSSGLRSGFANLEQLPNVFQMNVGIKRSFEINGQKISDQLTIENVLDRTNLIRPSGGLGVFQSAYGPRFTVFDSISVSF